MGNGNGRYTPPKSKATPPKKKLGKARLAWINPGQVSGRFMQGVIDTFAYDAAKPPEERRFDSPGGYIAIESGPAIADSRNRVVRNFLETDCEWLITIDADMTFNHTHIDRLLSVASVSERPIVGGLCFGGGHGSVFPTMYQIVDPKENNGDSIKWVGEWEEGNLVAVDATGAAFMAIHRQVFEKVRGEEPYPWYAFGAIGGVGVGEDFMFCIRCRRAGLPIYVDTGCPIGHVKTVELNEQLWREQRSSFVSKGNDSESALEVIEHNLVVVGAK